jgi:hypothetical protein
MGSTWKNRILVVGIKMNKDDKGMDAKRDVSYCIEF